MGGGGDAVKLPPRTCLPLLPSPWMRILPILMPLQHALNAFSMLSPLRGNEAVRIQWCWELPRDNRLGYFRAVSNYVIYSWQHAVERKHVPSNDWDPTQSFAENNSRVYRSFKPEKKSINTSHPKVILVLRNLKSLAWITGKRLRPMHGCQLSQSLNLRIADGCWYVYTRQKFGAHDATKVTCWSCDLFFSEWKMT